MSRFLLPLMVLISALALDAQVIKDTHGAMIRSDTSSKDIYLCFTGHDFFEGFEHVLRVLGNQKVPASFFLTGDFIREHQDLVASIVRQGHYVGAHSDQHLLYCAWSDRDSLLHSPAAIKADIQQNLEELYQLRIYPIYFMPPYEWYNQVVVDIANDLNQITVNFSPGTRSNADYTTPKMPNYISSEKILESIYQYEKQEGMNGFHLLIHPGTDPARVDKLYLQFIWGS